LQQNRRRRRREVATLPAFIWKLMLFICDTSFNEDDN